jgi:hypothetical protein
MVVLVVWLATVAVPQSAFADGPASIMSVGKQQFEGVVRLHSGTSDTLYITDAETGLTSELSINTVSLLTISTASFGKESGRCQGQRIAKVTADGGHTYTGCLQGSGTQVIEFITGSSKMDIRNGAARNLEVKRK